MTPVTIYTDGAAIPNPGHGAYGAVLMTANHQREISGYIGDNVTNNAAEITAAIEALKVLKWACVVTIYSDSQYLVNTMARGWSRNANLELWSELDRLCDYHDVQWKWIRGHAGNLHNERAHYLAMEVLTAMEIEL